MDCETNIDSIRALEEQIGEHERAVIRLKRIRNSLLNISKLPPELLGKIFRWNVTPKSDFDGLDEESHNFLLVCHHWFEVASCTPDLWNFWGNSLKDWARWCYRSGNAPLDLVLSGVDPNDDKYSYFFYVSTPRDMLQDRAARDAIRRVHLTARNWGLLDCIVDSLTSNHEEPRSSGVESIVLRNESGRPVDVSDFFACYRFPKLRRLELFYCAISSWNCLTSRTSVLTVLVLDFDHPSPTRSPPTPTTPQLLSVLASNPTLRKVGLTRRAIPDDGGGESSVQVQLHHLEELQLEGGLRHVIRLLDHLNHPRNIDHLSLTLYDSDITDTSQIIGPYLRGHLQRRDSPQNGLSLHVSSDNRIVFRAGDAEGINFSAPEWKRINPFIRIAVVPEGRAPESALRRAALDLITYTPPEEVVYFHAYRVPVVMEDTRTRFPNLRALSSNPGMVDSDPPSVLHTFV